MLCYKVGSIGCGYVYCILCLPSILVFSVSVLLNSCVVLMDEVGGGYEEEFVE